MAVIVAMISIALTIVCIARVVYETCRIRRRPRLKMSVMSAREVSLGIKRLKQALAGYIVVDKSLSEPPCARCHRKNHGQQERFCRVCGRMVYELEVFPPEARVSFESLRIPKIFS